MQLQKGQKVNLTPGRNNLVKLTMKIGWTASSNMSIDAAAFILSARNYCERDEDFIFYGNPTAVNGAVKHSATNCKGEESIHINLSELHETTAKIAFTVTIHEGEKQGHFFKHVTDLYLRLINSESGEELLRFNYGSDLSNETAIVAGELYRYGREWKFYAIGSGFYGGLEALCTNFGLEVINEEPETAASSQSIEKPILSTIDLRKKTLKNTLIKKEMVHVKARVGIVIDISGSMLPLYRDGTVQEVVERILAIACHFDDNASLDVWVYDQYFSRLPEATEKNFDTYVVDHILNNTNIHKFGMNNEPPVMEDVIHKYINEENSDLPVFIIFINDGGVVKAIKKVIANASVQPIFWQFVGIGRSDFKVLKNLDTMEGRVVDNANFIHLNDISAVNDETLYDRLLNEFPSWIKEARLKRIIR
ncbi:hypothetical protein YDYSY3_20300 [Paenibacillus chitinolyticus]|uniref:VWA domain-containing protein n=1 Tax=Paenibacillus chitinolyticus TaxID=79263 RepID=UPI0026E4FB29|nr:VWA domain-containing protein [Paenibacillus chitinolyticus]GKS11030.1 hypothetical protein YDYSY3_20300 [Paenibacillus chitinolyticus]